MDSGDWIHILWTLLFLTLLVVSSLILMLVGQVTNQRLLADANHSNQSRQQRSMVSVLNLRRTIAGATLLIQMLSTIFAANQIMSIVDSWTANRFNWLSVLIIILVYVIFGRALPRAISGKALSESTLDRLYSIGRGAITIVKPASWLEEQLSRLFGAILPGEDSTEPNYGSEEELRYRGLGTDDGVIGDNERQMIDGILSLEEMTVRDIMIPRLDIVALERRVSARELIDTITRAGHSRVPVYRDTIDNVLGVLYVKDLLPFVIGNTIRIPLLDLIRPAFVVPESKKLPELFTELKRTRIHLAIVTDEYGGTAGLVTIEDILEEIVGEIQDEYDTESPMFDRESDVSVIADGRLPIEDLEEALDIEFEEDEDFTTLGGFVHKHLGRLAVQGDEFEAEHVRVEILAVERHRVRRMRVTKLDRPEPAQDEERTERWSLRSSSDDVTDVEKPDTE